MVDIGSVNDKIVGGITNFAKNSFALNVIGYLLLGIIVIGLIAGYIWFRLEKRKYNKKIISHSIIHGYFYPTYRDSAKSVKVGRGGFEIIYLRKLKTWKLAHGARAGVNEYNFYILPDGYWYPGQVSANLFYIDEAKGMLPVETTNPTMRSQYTALEKQIETLHGMKQSFWDKYGNWVMTGTFIGLMGIFCWLSWREIAKFLGSGTELATQMNLLAENLNRITVNINNACGGNSGLVPA